MNIDKILLTEVFDEDSTYQLPTYLLNSKQKPTQTFAIQTPEDIPIVVKFAGTSVLGEKITLLKPTDKAMQIILFGLSEKGNLAALRNGLSDEPVAAINTILDLVKEKVKTQRLESVMFRFDPKKMKGKQGQVQRLIKIIAKKKFPQFETLDEINAVSQKHSYVVLYKKSTGLESKGLPQVSERFTKVETAVGETFVDTATGKQVSKPEAIAIEIADASDKTTDKSIMQKVKISRAAALTSMSRVEEPVMLLRQADKDQRMEILAEPPLHSAGEAEEVDLKGYFETSFKRVPNAVNLSKSNLTDFIWAHIADNYDDSNYQIGQELTDNLINSIHELMSSVKDNSNSFDTFKRAAEIVMKHPVMISNARDRKIILSKVCEEIMEMYRKTIEPAYSYMRPMEGHITPDQQRAIAGYCRQDFKEINNYLLGQTMSKGKISNIETMDEAFKNGVKIPKGTKLYRGHKNRKINELNRAAEDKVFVFKNFLSTSLIPIIFSSGNFSGYGASTQLDPNAVKPNPYSPENYFSDISASEVTSDDEDQVESLYSFVISGGEKVKVIIPGSISEYPAEAEVILPRGTILRIDNMTSAAPKAVERFVLQTLVEATVIPPEQLDESAEIFDGDLFLETGEVKPISGFKALYEAKKDSYNSKEVLSLLAEATGPVSEKFTL